MDYTELGAYLKEERERQGLSLDDVQQKTKISMSSLEAIESGQINELPHPVYAKGFIKNYAQLLGLNADELAGSFARTMGIDEELESDTEETEDFGPAGRGSKWPLVSVILSCLLLVALGWLTYDVFWAPGEPTQSSGTEAAVQSKAQDQMNQTVGTGLENRVQTEGQTEVPGASGEMQGAEQTTVSENTAPSTGDQGIESKTLDQKTNLETQAQGPSSSAGVEEPATVEEGEPAAEASGPETGGRGTETAGTQAAVATGGNAQQPAGSAESPAAVHNGEHALQIEASEACWMSAEIDSNKRDLYLRPGESVTFQFENSLELKLGNAGGVKLTYDGKAYPLDAASGEVLSLTFP